ncbi:TauD/TfdA family dioxygenase [Paraburkholderia sp. MM5482-R1]|uniref:TauD/TfdA family dioxygenase n=1 Tax=unclassified Paraburkholderia TaxID=2615204 RepID=UPI003D1DC270
MNTVIDDPCDWRGAAMGSATDWIHSLTPDEIDEIERAAAHAYSLGKTIDTLTMEDFPLPDVGVRLSHLKESLENQYGLYVLRGFPTEGKSVDDLRYIFWGIGLHLGTAVCQSYKGDFLGDVRDFGTSDGRLYNTNAAGGFHVDTCDVVGLFVVRPAKSGGLSRIASTVAIHNEIARTRPDLLEVLYQPFCWKTTIPAPFSAGHPPYFQQPLFSRVANKLSCLWLPVKINLAQGMEGVPHLTDKQREAIDLVTQLAESEEFAVSMMFEAGDMQFVNNHVCVHGRTAFEDYTDEARKRHLFRLWLSVPNSRELDVSLKPTYGEVGAGQVRGGIGRECGLRKYRTYEALVD